MRARSVSLALDQGWTSSGTRALDRFTSRTSDRLHVIAVHLHPRNAVRRAAPRHTRVGNPSVAGRGASYGVAGVEVDGNDVEAVARAAGEAVQRARSGGGPTLIECKTYRTRPHSEGMGDYTYRTREEVAAWRERCPIKRFRGELLQGQQVTAPELDALDAEIQAEVTAASAAAEQGPWPDPAAAATHVFCRE